MSHITNIHTKAIANTNFREVIFTGPQSQLVIMSIAEGAEVGEESHALVEQTLYIVKGVCMVTLDGKVTEVKEGDIVVVTPGTLHNFINKGNEAVKIITTYSPPNHIDGRIHITFEDAVNDDEDEAFSDEVNKAN